MYIKNYAKNTLVNTDHISMIQILPPQYERKDHIVSACVPGFGSQVLFRGTEEKCKTYLDNLVMLIAEEKRGNIQ